MAPKLTWPWTVCPSLTAILAACLPHPFFMAIRVSGLSAPWWAPDPSRPPFLTQIVSPPQHSSRNLPLIENGAWLWAAAALGSALLVCRVTVGRLCTWPRGGGKVE